MMLFYLPLIIIGGLWESMVTPQPVRVKVVAETSRKHPRKES